MKRLVAALLSGLAMAVGAGDAARRLDVALPHGWQRAANAVLVLQQVTTPAGMPLKLRVRIELADGGAIDVGIAGLLAQSATAGAQPVNLQLPAAPALAEFERRDPSAARVVLRIEPVDRSGVPITDLAWSIGSASIELRNVN